MTELSDLPPKERAMRYRSMADDAEQAARRATGAARLSYELLAKQWRRLADAADREKPLD